MDLGPAAQALGPSVLARGEGPLARWSFPGKEALGLKPVRLLPGCYATQARCACYRVITMAAQPNAGSKRSRSLQSFGFTLQPRPAAVVTPGSAQSAARQQPAPSVSLQHSSEAGVSGAETSAPAAAVADRSHGTGAEANPLPAQPQLAQLHPAASALPSSPEREVVELDSSEQEGGAGSNAAGSPEEGPSGKKARLAVSGTTDDKWVKAHDWLEFHELTSPTCNPSSDILLRSIRSAQARNTAHAGSRMHGNTTAVYYMPITACSVHNVAVRNGRAQLAENQQEGPCLHRSFAGKDLQPQSLTQVLP